MTPRFHLFPFRTQQLSSVVPKILGWRRPGKIGRCRHFALLAQLVEQLTLNQRAQGSSPWKCTRTKRTSVFGCPFCFAGLFAAGRVRRSRCAAGKTRPHPPPLGASSPARGRRSVRFFAMASQSAQSAVFLTNKYSQTAETMPRTKLLCGALFFFAAKPVVTPDPAAPPGLFRGSIPRWPLPPFRR